MNTTTMVAALELVGKTVSQQIAIIERRAKEVLARAIGRPCVSVTIGESILVTEWLTEGDALRAAEFFRTEMSRQAMVSYDADLGWVCEAVEV